jgi:hypothetical protein
MATNYPHQIASRGETSDACPADDGAGARLVVRARQLLCGLKGHDRLLQFEQHRIFLKCMSCGHESPGWAIAEAPHGVAEAAREQPRARVAPPFVDVRRIA